MSAVAVIVIVGFFCGLLALRVIGARMDQADASARRQPATVGRAILNR
ncbi:hypothetical protein [Nocardia sp. XZ_19_385]|nr:hypothetical protein [Nocardia sp. XZ_19_385]